MRLDERLRLLTCLRPIYGPSLHLISYVSRLSTSNISQHMNILLVDDHPLFRQAMAATINSVRDDIVVEQYETLAAVRRRLETQADIALILLDLKLPDSQGIAGLLSLKAHFPAVPIVIVSANDSSDTVETAIACGAAGFISKAAGMDELSAAIEALINGETWFPEPAAASGRRELSATQVHILDGVHRGMMNKQIAFELGLSEATVKYHLTSIFRVMGVQTRAQLVALTQTND
jgi:DNA-binding NarL/FixJ family response regulator